MREKILIDTGPLVAYLNADDTHHRWVVAQLELLEPPLYCCESVLTEAMHIVKSRGGEPERILAMVEDRQLLVTFHLEGELARVRRIFKRYADLPSSLADACLVRMAEIHENCRVFTLDSHFRVYRRHDRQVIPLLMPGKA